VHQIAPRLDQSSERAHLGALRLQSLELIAVPNQELERNLGIGRVILRPTRRERSAIARNHRGLDRKEHEEVVLEKRRHDRPLAQLQADRDRSSGETLPELLGPCPEGTRTMLEDESLTLLSSGNPEADVVLLVGPVDTDESCVRLFFHFMHVGSSRTVGVRDMRSRDPAKAIRRAGGAAFPEDSLRASVHPPVRT
jgi:hypothetical protein